MSNNVDQKAFSKLCDKYNGNYFIDNCEGLVKLVDVITFYESAKQPVRVDVGACAKAANAAVRKFFCNQNTDVGSVHQAIARAVLSVVKDAAKEMGVELEYETHNG